MATRVTLWGAGAGATAYAMACRTLGWTIDSVGSRSTGRARVLAEQVDAADAFGFDAATPAIGGLTIVVTPPADHPTAVDRVGDVVVVAPLAMTLAAADQMVDLGASMLRVFGWPLVSAPTTQELMRRAGGIGTPTSLAMSASRPLPDWGGYATDRWGGGALVFVGHDLVALTLLLSRFVGLGPPVAVAATMSSDGDGPDRSVAVRLMFADGFVATVDAAWSNGGSPRADAQLSGTDGVLRIDSDPAPSLEHDGETVPLARPALADPPLALVYTYRYFTSSISPGRQV